MGLTKSKTLICTRNPFDVHVSWYHFTAKMPEHGSEFCKADLTLPEFLKIFRDNEHVHGSWLAWHNSWAEEAKNNSNVYIYHFEDLVMRPEETILGIARFLDIRVSDSHMDRILKFINIKNMKSMENKKAFEAGKVRDGRIGNSLKILSKKMIGDIKQDLNMVDGFFKHQEIVDRYLNFLN